MRRRLVVIASAIATLAATGLPAAALTSPATTAQRAPLGVVGTLLGTVPSVVRNAVDLGALNPLQTLHIAVPLTLPDQASLNRALTAENAPGSASYHRFMTPAQFGEHFGASTGEIGLVTHVLSSLGLTVATPSPNHLYLDASGTVALLETVFNTKIANFSLSTGLKFFSNTSNIRLPQQLLGAVTGVIGLDDSDRPEPALADPAAAGAGDSPALGPVAVDGGASPCGAAVAGAGYTAPQLATAYDFNGLYKKHLLGQGMSAALVEFDDYHNSNVRHVESCYHLHTHVSRHLVDGGSGGPPTGAEIEDMADISTMLEMLPKLSRLDVYVAPNIGPGEVDLYNRFATQDRDPVISSSWGSCEELDSQADNRLFADITEEAAAQGQQILTAAGDSGAVGCGGYPAPNGTSISVEQEAAVPWVTGVGGTDLGQLTADGLSPKRDEATWNSDGAGGGGVSTMWPMPKWQYALKSARLAPGHSRAACGAPRGELCREVPDISANADQGLGMQGGKLQFPTDVGSAGYSIYCGTPNCALTTSLGLPLPIPITPPAGLLGWEPVGGTSLATPLTASAAVLWDQEAKRAHLSGLGLLNPSLYRVAASPTRYARDFHDITTDSNDDQYALGCAKPCNPHHLYPAHKGYDMATGLGSYDAANLGNDLVAQADRITVTPSTATVYGYTDGIATTTPVVASTGYRKSSYTAHSSASWLHVKNGSAPGSLHWSADPAGLATGLHLGRITIRSHGHRSSLAVRYSVSKRARIHLSARSLHFSERAINAKGKPTTPTCGTTLWNDELFDTVNDSTGTKVDGSTRRVLRITNRGPRGSTLHWQAFAYSETSAWLGTDLSRGKPATRPGRPLVPTGGTDGHGKTSALPLVSTANSAGVSGYPLLNQGTYHGLIKVVDLADPHIVKIVYATLRLGSGRHTPHIQVAAAPKHVTVMKGHAKTITVKLADASHSCGYFYSLGSDQPWAQPNVDDDSGVVAAHGSGSASGSDTGDGTGTIAVRISAKGLSVGVHRLRFTVQSENAEPNPTLIHVAVRVDH